METITNCFENKNITDSLLLNKCLINNNDNYQDEKINNNKNIQGTYNI